MFPHAYAIIKEPGRAGRYRSVYLKNVIAEEVISLEPSGRTEPPAFAVQRCVSAMDERHRRREWG